MRVGEREEAIRPARVLNTVNGNGKGERFRVARRGRDVGNEVVVVHELEAVLFACGEERDDEVGDADGVVDVQAPHAPIFLLPVEMIERYAIGAPRGGARRSAQGHRSWAGGGLRKTR